MDAIWLYSGPQFKSLSTPIMLVNINRNPTTRLEIRSVFRRILMATYHDEVHVDDWTATVALFSPDSKWLAINLRNTDLPNATITPALVNVHTCQVVPLPNLNGEIRG